jgi:hypothetical protein
MSLCLSFIDLKGVTMFLSFFVFSGGILAVCIIGSCGVLLRFCICLLASSRIFSPLLLFKFQQLLAARLGSLHRISLHDCLPQQHLFIRSPLRAIIALFSLDQLLITCENEVLKLLITWIARNKPSKEDIKELRKCVRVGHLDLTVINEVLEKVDWFGFSSKMPN